MIKISHRSRLEELGWRMHDNSHDCTMRAHPRFGGIAAIGGVMMVLEETTVALAAVEARVLVPAVGVPVRRVNKASIVIRLAERPASTCRNNTSRSILA